MTRKAGLTLMELLVVISILATLAALLFPVYLRVRSRMYAISCANQLRQIGLAIRIYIQDQGGDSPYNMPYGLGKLYPHYVRDKNLLVCPYFQILFPGVMEEAHQLSQKLRGEPWSSYFQMIPVGIDDAARYGEGPSFSEVFAKRGDQTPIVYCSTHRVGCPDTNNELFKLTPKYRPFAQYCSKTYPLYQHGVPILILRWGGNVSFIYKGSANLGTFQVLLDY